MPSRRPRLLALLSLLSLPLLACGASKSEEPGAPADSGGGSETAGDGTASDTTSGDPELDTGAIGDSSGGDAGDDTGDDGAVDTGVFDVPPYEAPPKVAVVYAHSSSTLYRLDPKALTVVLIGAFVDTSGTSITDMTDIALDEGAVMYGVTFGALYRIDYKATKPTCTKLADLGTSFNGLTFVPAGMIDPTKEVLIGNSNDGGWHRIDIKPPSSATITKLGSYGSGWLSSGDSVGIIGDQVYATVQSGGNDHVIVVDPKTGALKKDLGDTGVTGLWGVGYWDGVMYGFASSGSLYKIDLKTAKATEIPLSSKPSGGWWGAGVTTAAPRGVP